MKNDYFRVDSVVSYIDNSGEVIYLARLDADKCHPPNKPCGNACFPPGKKCYAGLTKVAKRVAIGAAVAGAGGVAYANRDKIKQGVNNANSELKFRKLEKEHRGRVREALDIRMGAR